MLHKSLPLFALSLLLLCGCRRAAGPSGAKAGVNGFKTEEKAVKTAIQEEYGKEAEFLSWGPHHRFSEEELVRFGNHPVIRPRDCMIRVVFRGKDDENVMRRFDVLLGVRDGEVQGERPVIDGRRRANAIPNPAGDDWFRTFFKADR